MNTISACLDSSTYARHRKRLSVALLTLALFAASSYVLWQLPTLNVFTKPDETTEQPGISGHKELPLELAAPSLIAPSKSLSTEDFELEGPFDGSALAAICEKTSWQEGLYFDCSNNSGGIGNMRNFILTCIRYAIDAGASLIQPTIRKRSESRLADLFTTYMPLGYMFDETHFLQSMQTYCPQMKIVKNRKSMPNASHQFYKPDVVARDMANHMDNDGHGFDANRWAGTFREDLDWWLANSYGHVPSHDLPVVLSWKWALFFSWPIWLDGPEFANTFGRLLKIRPDVADIALRVVQALEATVDGASLPNNTSLGHRLDYIGVHLRVESDCLDWWPKEPEQISHYIQRIEQLHLQSRVIYIATGLSTGLDHFKANASTHLQSPSYSKEMLLQGKDLAALKALQWDQQALVDYLVLLRSRYFLGMFQSSFSQNIASRRHLLRDGIHTTIWRGYYDEFSYLYGLRRAYNGIHKSTLAHDRY